MRKPLITKKMSTPMYPPGKMDDLAWNNTTVMTANARRPSSPR